jgi:hypothetical protein
MAVVQRRLLLALLVAIPFFSFSLLNVRNIPIGRLDILIVFLLVFAFLLSMLTVRRTLLLNRAFLWICWLNVATFLSIVNLYLRPTFSLLEFVTMAGQLFLASVMILAVSNLRVDRVTFLRILQVWLLVAAGVAAYAVYQSFARNLGWPFAYLDLSNPSYVARTVGGQFGGYIRPSSVFFEPSRLGTFLVGPLILAAITLAARRHSSMIFRRRSIHWLVLLTLSLGTLLSFTLTAYLALMFALVIVVLSSKVNFHVSRPSKTAFGVGIGIVAVVVVLELIGISFLAAFERVGRVVGAPLSDGSVAERAARAIVALKIWIDNPLFGVGVNQVQFVSGAYSFPSWYPYGNTAFVTTGVLWPAILSQIGIIGFIAFAMVFVSSLRMLRSSMKSCDDPDGRVVSYAFWVILWTITVSVSLTYVELMLWIQLALAHLLANNVRRFKLFRNAPAAV